MLLIPCNWGGETVKLWDGTGILLELDIEDLTWGHIPVVLDGRMIHRDPIGEVGEVMVEGVLPPKQATSHPGACAACPVGAAPSLTT